MTRGRVGSPLIAIDARPALVNISGVGRYVFNLVTHLAQLEGHRLAVIVNRDVHPGLLSLDGVEVVDGGHGSEQVGYVERARWEQTSLAKILSRCGAHVFHATWNYGVPWNCPCPSVITVHDLIPIYRPEFGSRSFRLAFLSSQYLALTKAAAVIAVSRSTAAEVGRYVPWVGRRVSVVYEAADPVFSTLQDHDAGAAEKNLEEPYLLYVGGLTSRKNIANLLRAFEIVGHVEQALNLKILGRAENLSDDARSVHEGMNDTIRRRVVFVGRLTDGELARLYRGAFMLVHPSHAEGFGFPPLEAMASGVPVVTTRRGSIPEIVQTHAVFVEPDVPESIAEGILRVCRDGALRSSLMRGGLARARELTWRTAAEQTSAIYQRIVR